jgi:hypothetical protein
MPTVGLAHVVHVAPGHGDGLERAIGEHLEQLEGRERVEVREEVIGRGPRREVVWTHRLVLEVGIGLPARAADHDGLEIDGLAEGIGHARAILVRDEREALDVCDDVLDRELVL